GPVGCRTIRIKRSGTRCGTAAPSAGSSPAAVPGRIGVLAGGLRCRCLHQSAISGSGRDFRHRHTSDGHREAGAAHGRGGMLAVSGRCLRARGSRDRGARVSVGKPGSVNIDVRGGLRHWPAGSGAHPGAPPGGRLRPSVLESLVRVCLLGLACGTATFAAGTRLHVMIPMRDGVRLAANVFLPPGKLRAPVILERTPYGKGVALTPNHQAYVDHGYILVVQDVRGRYASEGRFNPLHQEGPDGDDTLNWIASQPW